MTSLSVIQRSWNLIYNYEKDYGFSRYNSIRQVTSFYHRDAIVLPGESSVLTIYVFNTLYELQDFYLSAMKYINDTLSAGWIEKDSINWEPYKKY